MIKHILSNGEEKKTIDGHLITRQDAPSIYSVIERVRHESCNGKKKEKLQKHDIKDHH